MSFAPALALREGDRKKLGELARLPSVPSGLAKRARMILLAAGGVPNAEIARLAGVSRPTVIAWRERYESGGIAAPGRAGWDRDRRRDAGEQRAPAGAARDHALVGPVPGLRARHLVRHRGPGV